MQLVLQRKIVEVKQDRLVLLSKMTNGQQETTGRDAIRTSLHGYNSRNAERGFFAATNRRHKPG